MSVQAPRYRGRFAPSPTGPLHIGSLTAALASFLEARTNGGEWLLRIEDVDEPRCSRENAEDILLTLENFGFEWDGEVVWQNQRKAAYGDALERLKRRGLAFPCACSRKELADSSVGAPQASDGGLLYPGTCRNGLPPGRTARAWRLRVDDVHIEFTDAIQGEVRSALRTDTGDFVLLRADGYFAYQLAVVVDDAEAGITHIVRGADLLHSTPRQIHLQRCLGLITPHYAHLPVLTNVAGEKLSKQTLAPALDTRRPTSELLGAWCALGQIAPPNGLEDASPTDFWAWALGNWAISKVPRRAMIVQDTTWENEK